MTIIGVCEVRALHVRSRLINTACCYLIRSIQCFASGCDHQLQPKGTSRCSGAENCQHQGKACAWHSTCKLCPQVQHQKLRRAAATSMCFYTDCCLHRQDTGLKVALCDVHTAKEWFRPIPLTNMLLMSILLQPAHDSNLSTLMHK